MTCAACVHGSWLPQWRNAHARTAPTLLCLILGLAVILPAGVGLGATAQVGALVIAVAVFGVPHGVLDPLVAQRWLAPKLGPRWRAPFHVGYVVLGGLVLVG